MNILITGKRNKGSWVIRGEQLGRAMGATVKPLASPGDIDGADVVVAVKRITPQFLQHVKRTGRRWVWDLVDFYPQPACTGWGAAHAIRWVRSALRDALPSAIIWPNNRMREDCDIGVPGLVLYHHHYPKIEKNPIRERIKKIGYEGAEHYLGEWRTAAEKACKERHIELCVNSGAHSDWDVCMAARGREHCGYAQRRWKSNVKLANAHGSGTPFIGSPENSYIETHTGGELFIDRPDQIGAAIDSIESYERRKEISKMFLANALSVETVAKKYKEFLIEHG